MPRAVPYAFLSSRIEPLEAQRLSIRAACKELGVDIWVSEIERRELRGKSLAQIAEVCLAMTWTASVFVLLLEGSYGTTASAELGDLSILELEIALATLSSRPIYAFQLSSGRDRCDARLEGLLNMLSQIPNAVVYATFGREELLTAQIARLLKEHSKARVAAERRESALLRRLIRRLDPRITDAERELASSTPRSPFPMIHPLPKALASTTRALELLSEAETLPNVQRRLLRLWSALRHLAAIPWRETDDPSILHAWLRLLSEWDRSTAWLGTHNSNFLSRLAAQKERHEVWKRLQEVAPDATPSVGAERVSASLLYSMAKSEGSLVAKRRLRLQALSMVNSALEATTASDVSGLLSTRAYILLRLGHPVRARRDSARALHLRREGDEGAGRIGEAEATHGWMQAWCLRVNMASRLLESGVAKLRGTNRHGFTVRAMRQLGFVQALRLRLSNAEATWREAEQLALKHELRDQVGQLRRLLSSSQGLRSRLCLWRRL